MAEPLADGRVRILYAARDEHSRAHIGSADVSLADGAADHRPAPLLGPGRLGAFDDSGVTTSCLVEHDGVRFLYYTGWTLGTTVPFHLAIGCALSRDGASFERASEAPVLGRTHADPLLTASPSILVESGRWRMWYVAATRWNDEGGRPKHWYLIKYAESADGLVWEPHDRVCVDFADPSEYAMGRPCVRRGDDGVYRMWFCVRGDSYRLAYAESSDGLVWQRDDSAARLLGQAEGWESQTQAYPWVVDTEGGPALLYNGNGYGATGIGWASPEAD